MHHGPLVSASRLTTPHCALSRWWSIKSMQNGAQHRLVVTGAHATKLCTAEVVHNVASTNLDGQTDARYQAFYLFAKI